MSKDSCCMDCYNSHGDCADRYNCYCHGDAVYINPNDKNIKINDYFCVYKDYKWQEYKIQKIKTNEFDVEFWLENNLYRKSSKKDYIKIRKNDGI